MTSFVEILPEEYDKDAFERFDASASDFKIDNARALMWFSQLAYETHRQDTIDAVSPKWNFTSVTPFSERKIGLKNSFETCGLIGERADAVILAFAGTDPGVWQNLVTDFTPVPEDGSDIHNGFRVAAKAAEPDVAKAIARCQLTGKPLFVAGHSLGAALAALAARQASAASVKPLAVYGFGMPRVGGPQFQASYDADLGDVTYRLVHGDDLVARVPPSRLLTGFRHVGRLLRCAADTKFDGARPLSAVGLDEPNLSGVAPGTVQRGLAGLFSGHVLSPAGPGTFGSLFPFLPTPIRDHLQDSYWKALTP
jgi:triacylglycerol lipase